MDKNEVVTWLRSLTDKQFVELFYEAVEGRHICEPEKEYHKSHLVLAEASKIQFEDDTWDEWEVSLVCPTPGKSWADDMPLCQIGGHCNLYTISWAKESTCPVCGGDVYGT